MKHHTVFGIIGAMEAEVSQLRGKLEGRKEVECCGLTFYDGTLGGHRMVLVRSGVGKVNAARCCQILIDRFAVDRVVNTGIAGGVGEGLAVADVVIGTELLEHDFDVRTFGYVRGNICDRAHADRPTVFRSDPELCALFRASAESLLDAKRVKTGRIVTGDVFVASAEHKRDLAETFGAVAAEMEGGAIAHTAHCARVPFVVVRAISDLADGSIPPSFERFEQETADLSAAIIEKMIVSQ